MTTFGGGDNSADGIPTGCVQLRPDTPSHDGGGACTTFRSGGLTLLVRLSIHNTLEREAALIAPQSIKDLVAQFAANLSSYQSPTFKETPTREQFINPLFEALGWNVRSLGLSEVEKEVVLEHPLQVGGSTKSIDYAFRLSGINRFVVEAKPPHRNLATDPQPANQLRRYGWNLALPLGIVTDFEEFAIYDCRVRPGGSQDARAARLAYYKFTEYEEKWEEIASLFGREAVLAGSVEQWALSAETPQGTQPVDAAFLADMNQWREMLARDIASANPNLTDAELNFAVQSTLDRIVFLRICEDRGLEREGDLLDATRGEGSVYDNLLEVFYRADQRYNSGLFHFRTEHDRRGPDKLTPNIKVGDTALKWIVGNLYGARNVYEFRAIPADILGRVYEQFLGKVIVRRGSSAQIDDKPDVRKKGGVYYTPEWVVDYIVEETLRPLLDSATRAGVTRLRVIDPACGSGSFLIAAYQHLLDWHLDYYTSRDTARYRKELERDAFGNWRLTLPERRRILLNNIYGVDIDPQAVEVAKLSLLLKVIEGERQMVLAVGQLLPDLGANLKLGNSLVEPDLAAHLEPSTLSEEDWQGLSPFDWRAAFPEIMSAGGFDAVIGNPPYFGIDSVWGAGDSRAAYLKGKYSDIHTDKTDILFYFIYRALQLSKGEVGVIVSRAFLEAVKAKKLRQWISNSAHVREIVDFQNAQVFPGVGITTAILRLTKATQSQHDVIARRFKPSVIPHTTGATMVREPDNFMNFQMASTELGGDPWNFVSDEVRALLARMDSMGQRVDSVLHVGQGMQTGANSVFAGVSRADVEEWQLPPEAWFLRARNRDVAAYHLNPSRDEVILYPNAFDRWADVPEEMRAYLSQHREKLEGRAAFKRGNCEWWKYTWPLHATYVNAARLLVPYMAGANRFALDQNATFLGLTDTTVLYANSQPESLWYIMAILNSTPLTAFLKSSAKLRSAGIYEYFENTVGGLPIVRLDPAADLHVELTELAQQTSQSASAVAAARTSDHAERATTQLNVLRNTIDEKVLGLFGLTTAEGQTLQARA